MSIPNNLQLLHRGEDELRAKTLEFVQQSPDLGDHLELTERTMDILDMLRQHHEATDDGKTIVQLGMRCFNSFAAAWKLTASGYYQAAVATLRDLIETSELVDYFFGAPEQIEVWRNADPKQLVREFGPSVIRKALDDRAGLGKSRREQIYKKFCTLGSHPTLNGFAMLRPDGMDAVIGPFVDLMLLRPVLEETGELAVRVGFVFNLHLDTSIDPCNQIAHRFLAGAMEYSWKYLGKAYTQAERDEVDRLFGGSE